MTFPPPIQAQTPVKEQSSFRHLLRNKKLNPPLANQVFLDKNWEEKEVARPMEERNEPLRSEKRFRWQGIKQQLFTYEPLLHLVDEVVERCKPLRSKYQLLPGVNRLWP